MTSSCLIRRMSNLFLRKYFPEINIVVYIYIYFHGSDAELEVVKFLEERLLFKSNPMMCVDHGAQNQRTGSLALFRRKEKKLLQLEK